MTGTFFHYSAWLVFVRRAIGLREPVEEAHTILEINGEPSGAFPLFIIGGNRGVSLPLGDYGGPVLSSLDGSEAALLTLLEKSGKLGSVRAKSVPEAMHPAFRSAGFRIGPHMSTFILDLHKGIGGHSEHSIRRDARRGIRSAWKAGVAIREATTDGDDPEKYSGLHMETASRLGIPERGPQFFRLLWNEIIQSGLGRATFAESDGRAIAGLICLLNPRQGAVHVYSNVSNPRASELHANDLLYWDALTWASDSGYNHVDMGLSPLDPEHNLCRFKQKWGSERRVLYYCDRVNPVLRLKSLLGGRLSRILPAQYRFVPKRFD